MCCKCQLPNSARIFNQTTLVISQRVCVCTDTCGYIVQCVHICVRDSVEINLILSKPASPLKAMY